MRLSQVGSGRVGVRLCLLQVAAIMSERAKMSENEDDIPSITLTIINVHPSHLVDAKFHLRREMQTAEAAGAKIVIKV